MSFVIFIYCALTVVASLVGGWVPLLLRLTHRRMQIAISFVAGVMLGVGLLHLLPHSYYELESIDGTVWWVLVGFMLMFFLERFFHFHHHDAPDDLESSQPGHEPAMHHDHVHDHGDHAAPHGHQLSWGGALIGLTLHSVVDGIALAAAFIAEQHEGQGPRWAGLGTFMAIVLHKPFDSMTIGTLMAAGGWSRNWRHVVNGLYSLAAPCGVALFFLGAHQFDHAFLGRALGFAAGAFLCIATSDLLPELQFHSHDRGKLSIALLLGIALAWTIVYFESSGHDHSHSPAVSQGHQHSEAHEH